MSGPLGNQFGSCSSWTSSGKPETSGPPPGTGVTIWQNLFDLWTITETIQALRPKLIIETPVGGGGWDRTTDNTIMSRVLYH